MTEFLKDLIQAAGGSEQVLTKEPMKKHTTFRTGGPADYYVSPTGETELAAVVSLCQKQQVPYYILGNGSNLLVSDSGYPGVIISMTRGFSQITEKDGKITAGSGALLSRIAKTALLHSLAGFEFAAGIPGTLGGAVVMNAGAYGGEMKQVLQSARVLTKNGEIQELAAEELELGYRKSGIQQNGYIVLSAVISLEQGEPSGIKAKMDDFAARRREKQPLEYPSAGSTFKRPEGYFAGRLIEDAGLKGLTVGGAQVSEKHSGFVINRNGASSADVFELCRQVQKKVKEQFGVELEMEVKRLGEFPDPAQK